MKGKHYIRNAVDHLNSARRNYYMMKEHNLPAEESRLMMLAAEDAIRQAGFTVKWSEDHYEVKCKWDDAPEETKR